tara:strand:- start:627 stop:1652 length:1026 start_codon:yes stop_codon:yes gene_type:complete
MSQTTYSNPRLFLANKEILDFSSITYKNKGNNKVSTLSVKINDPEIDDSALLGKEIVFYLNEGCRDSVPFFRGFVRQYTPSDKDLSITAHDVLSFLAGAESPPLTLSDHENYDGYTLGQMLFDYINTNVNKTKTIIGLDMLNDSDPPITMTGFRKENITPLKVVQELLKPNESDLTDIKNTRLVVRDDGVKSNICFVQEQDKDSAGAKFSFNDGIESVSYKKRRSPNFYTTQVDNNQMTYQHNSLPTGIVMGNLKGDFKYPDQARQQAFIDATASEDKKEISIKTNKGHYLEIGNVINVQTSEHPELTGKHRIVSKVIGVGSKTSCTLGLSKDAPQITDYI